MKLKTTKDLSFPQARRLAEQEAGASYASVLARTAGHFQRPTPRLKVNLDPQFNFSAYSSQSSDPFTQTHSTQEKDVPSTDMFDRLKQYAVGRSKKDHPIEGMVTATERLTKTLPSCFGSVGTQPEGPMQPQAASSAVGADKSHQPTKGATGTTIPPGESGRLSASIISSSQHSYPQLVPSSDEESMETPSLTEEDDFTIVPPHSRRSWRGGGRGRGSAITSSITRPPDNKALSKKNAIGALGPPKAKSATATKGASHKK